jgi:mycothiol synthase
VNLRPASREDIPAIVALFEAGSALYEEPYISNEEVRQWLTSPKLDLARDVRLAFDRGRLVGYIDAEPLAEAPVRWWCGVRAHPDADFSAVVPALIGWAEERAGEGILRAWAPSRLEPQLRAYEGRGLQRVRSSYRMEIDLDATLTPPIFPDGIEVRPMREGEERVAYDVHEETFEDSWEYTREPYEEWRHFLVETELFDPSLWFLAWAGEVPAGVAICRNRKGVGWVQVLGVRRPWRRRGLGRALLLQAFHEFRRKGLRHAGLGVDAESLTGANRLYESMGMRVTRRLEIFEKPLGPG